MEERLKKFAAIVDYGSFTVAARELHVSQPGLTSVVQKLEKELKTELLIRPSRKITLTSAGKLAYDRGNRLKLAARNFDDELRRLSGDKPPFNVGCIDSLAYHSIASRLLDELEEKTQLSLTIQSSNELLDQLKRGRLDIAIIVDQEADLPELARYKLGQEAFILVCARARFAEYRQALKDKHIPDFLSYDSGSNTNRTIKAQLTAHGITLEPRIYSTNPSVLLQLAAQGKGVAALPRTMLDHFSDTDLSQLDLAWSLGRPVTAYWRKGRHLPRVIIPLWRSMASSDILEFS